MAACTADPDPRAFADGVRAALAACYSPEELTQLEHSLAQPASALHVRCNLLKCTRERLLAQLAEVDHLAGYAIEPHETLWDVIIVHRRQRAPALAAHLALEASGVKGTERFAERRRLSMAPHELFVDRICGEAVLKGADIFVRGVRGASQGLKAGDTVSVYADLHGALLRGSVCESLDGMRFLGVGVCCIERAALFREASGLAVRMQHVVEGDLPSLSGLYPDQMYVQSLPSLTASHVLAAMPGERVLDMCGAPGSKSTHIATNFLRDAPGSVLVTCERHQGKLSKLAALCEVSFGLSCVQPTRADSARLGAGGRIPGLSFELGSFDRVLLDPPCSALGLRPRLLQTATSAALEQVVPYQRAFLWCAVRLLRTGGTLVYSTCVRGPEYPNPRPRLALGPSLRSVAAAHLPQTAKSATPDFRRPTPLCRRPSHRQRTNRRSHTSCAATPASHCSQRSRAWAAQGGRASDSPPTSVRWCSASSRVRATRASSSPGS